MSDSVQEHKVQTYLIKRDEPTRPRRRERTKSRVSTASTTATPAVNGNSIRSPSLILNAGLLASALTCSNDSSGQLNFDDSLQVIITIAQWSSSSYYLSVWDENYWKWPWRELVVIMGHMVALESLKRSNGYKASV